MLINKQPPALNFKKSSYETPLTNFSTSPSAKTSSRKSNAFRDLNVNYLQSKLKVLAQERVGNKKESVMKNKKHDVLKKPQKERVMFRDVRNTVLNHTQRVGPLTTNVKLKCYYTRHSINSKENSRDSTFYPRKR